MLQHILNLNGVTVLDKKQQGSINGGQACRFTIIYKGGGRRQITSGGYSEGSAGSAEANSDCASVVGGSVSRCFYNCAHDGWEQ